MITVDFQCLRLNAHSRVLDIGCGTGRHTAAACDMNAGSVIGADPNLNDLQQARERLELHARWRPSTRSTWSLAAADITRLPFRDGSVDVVICSEVLEHVADHRHAIDESARVLKPGGQLVVSIPRRWPETICWALSRQYRNTPGGHIRIFQAPRLMRLIRSKGFEFWRTHHAHSLHAPYWWLKCLVGIDRQNIPPVAAYQRFLTWDMMKKPRVSRTIEKLLNPLMGKSVVMYFRKFGAGETHKAFSSRPHRT